MTKGVKKVLNICIIFTIIVAIGFTALMFILRYIEDGEQNMPFEVTKITIVSTTDAQDVEDKENRWNEKVIQNNDVYIDIKKNESFPKKRIISKVNIDNLEIKKEPQEGAVIFYQPSKSDIKTFENQKEYKISKITFTGDKETEIKDLKISNQGGRIAFRCANENIGTYISNEDDELNYDMLLQKIGINNEQINMEISFDLSILLTNGQIFKANIDLTLPEEGIIEKGKASKEITDLDIAFRRVEN